MMEKLLYLIVSLSSVGLAEEQIQISPALAEMMKIEPLDPKRLENNFYVGQMGAVLPQEDYLEATKTYFLQNDALGIKNVEHSILGSLLNIEPSQLVFAVMNSSSLEGLLPTIEKVSLSDFVPNNQTEILVDLPPMVEGEVAKVTDYFPCQDYLKFDCVAGTQKNNQYIHKVIVANRVLLDRLLWRIDHSDHNEVILPQGMNLDMASLPGYGQESTVYMLNLSQAILNITEGKFEDGINGLSQARKRIDITYAEKSTPLLIDLMVVIAQTQYLDQAMDGLLNSGILNEHLNNAELGNIFKPYGTQIGQVFQKSLIFEMKDGFKSRALPYLNIQDTDLSKMRLGLEDQYIVLKYWQDKGVRLSPQLQQLWDKLNSVNYEGKWKHLAELEQYIEQLDKGASLLQKVKMANLSETMKKKAPIYSKLDLAEFEKLYKQTQELLDDWYEIYFTSIGGNPTQLLRHLNQQYPSTKYFNSNFAVIQQLEKLNNEGVILTMDIMQDIVKNRDQSFVGAYINAIDDYTMRLYEQQNYHQLVYLKYLIMRDNISIKDIPEFLNSMGDLAKNTITKEQYHFDVETRILSTPFSVENRQLPYSVKRAQIDNSDIQAFSVKIP